MSACVEWPGRRYPNGYGSLFIYHGDKVSRYMAHRVEYERRYGEIPAGLVIHHLCENKLCVNPEHMIVCTQKANIRFSRQNMRRIRCPQGHDAYQVKVEGGKEVRRCLICRKQQQETRKERLRLLRG